jgi:heptosyltransferase-2
MKILVISLAGIGDTIFATPLIHELRVNFAQAQVDALVLWKGSKDLLEGNPHLTHLYQKNLIKAGKLETLEFLMGVRKNRYDFSINTHPQSRIHYRFVARIIGAQTRISHRYDHSSVLDDLLVNRTIPQDYTRHAVENNLALLPLLEASPRLGDHSYEIHLSEQELAWRDAFLSKHDLPGHKILGIHVGSGGTKNLALRRWPLASYEELIRRLNNAFPHLAILLFGGPEEEKDHARILKSNPSSVFQPKTENFRQTAALVKKCDAFLSVDTALMHVAAAMKVPRQVVIETPTWNKPIEPYNNKFILVRNPMVAGNNLNYYRYDGCGIRGTPEQLTRCMASVSVEEVFAALGPF